MSVLSPESRVSANAKGYVSEWMRRWPVEGWGLDQPPVKDMPEPSQEVQDEFAASFRDAFNNRHNRTHEPGGIKEDTVRNVMSSIDGLVAGSTNEDGHGFAVYSLGDLGYPGVNLVVDKSNGENRDGLTEKSLWGSLMFTRQTPDGLDVVAYSVYETPETLSGLDVQCRSYTYADNIDMNMLSSEFYEGNNAYFEDVYPATPFSFDTYLTNMELNSACDFVNQLQSPSYGDEFLSQIGPMSFDGFYDGGIDDLGGYGSIDGLGGFDSMGGADGFGSGGEGGDGGSGGGDGAGGGGGE